MNLNTFFSIKRLECLEDIVCRRRLGGTRQGRASLYMYKGSIWHSRLTSWFPGPAWSWIGTTTYDEGCGLLKNLRGRLRWLLFPKPWSIIKVEMKTSSLYPRFLFLFWDPEIWEFCGPIIIVYLTYIHTQPCCQSLVMPK